MKKYFRRMKGHGECPPRKPMSKIAWSWVGAFFGISAILICGQNFKKTSFFFLKMGVFCFFFFFFFFWYFCYFDMRTILKTVVINDGDFVIDRILWGFCSSYLWSSFGSDQ